MLEKYTPRPINPGIRQPRSTAERLVDAMDWLTDLRHDGSPLMGLAVACTAGVRAIPDNESDHGRFLPGLDPAELRGYVAIGCGLLGLTDMEGKGIWLARKLDPNVETPYMGGERDHLADKRYTYSLLGGLAARAMLESDTRDASFMLAVLGVNMARDSLMQHERNAARSVNPLINTNAIWINKWKTALLMAGANMAVSKWGSHGKGRAISRTLLTAGTGTGIVGYFKFRRLLRNNVASFTSAQ